jgi:hypothetical protein
MTSPNVGLRSARVQSFAERRATMVFGPPRIRHTFVSGDRRVIA